MIHENPNEKELAKTSAILKKSSSNDVIQLAGLCTPEHRLNTKDSRTTFIVNKRQLKKIKKIAYLQRTTIKNVVSLAFDMIILEHEKLNGEISTVSQKTSLSINNQ